MTLHEKDERRAYLLYMLDLKMDVGYHREYRAEHGDSYLDKAKGLKSFLKEMSESKELFGKSGTEKKSKTDKNAPKFHFSMADGVGYDMVIITAANSGAEWKRNNLIDNAKDTKTNIWLMSTGQHPNEYEIWEEDKVQPCQSSWSELIRKISNQFTT